MTLVVRSVRQRCRGKSKGQRPKVRRSGYVIWNHGAPGGIRTPDLQIRSLPLYPTELQARSLESNSCVSDLAIRLRTEALLPHPLQGSGLARFWMAVSGILTMPGLQRSSRFCVQEEGSVGVTTQDRGWAGSGNGIAKSTPRDDCLPLSRNRYDQLRNSHDGWNGECYRLLRNIFQL